jgi:nitric oxide reductase activation protein
MGVERHDIEQDCPLEKRCISFGIGSSKKEGEQNAAKMALIIHGILKEDQYIQSDIYYPPWDKIAAFDGENMIIKIDDHVEDVSSEIKEYEIETEIETKNKIIESKIENKKNIIKKTENNKKTNKKIEKINLENGNFSDKSVDD